MMHDGNKKNIVLNEMKFLRCSKRTELKNLQNQCIDFFECRSFPFQRTLWMIIYLTDKRFSI